MISTETAHWLHWKNQRSPVHTISPWKACTSKTNWTEWFLAVAMLIPSPGDGMRWCRRLADELRKCWIDNAMFVGFTSQDKQFVIANQSEVFVQPAAREQSSDLWLAKLRHVTVDHQPRKWTLQDLLIISENGKQLALFSLSFVPVCFTDFNTQYGSTATRKGIRRNFIQFLTELFYWHTVEDLRLSSRIFYQSWLNLQIFPSSFLGHK